MAILDVREAIEWQARHAEEAERAVHRAGGPRRAGDPRQRHRYGAADGQLARASRSRTRCRCASPAGCTGCAYRARTGGWCRSMQGLLTDQARSTRSWSIWSPSTMRRLMAWLDSPPQTNEAGRSASVMAGLLWLSRRLGPKFELNEIGASAGVNTMMGRYHYNLGGVTAGPSLSRMKLAPEWRGPPPPHGKVEIVAMRGSDIAPIDLTDPAQALRLKAYVWPEATTRMDRLDIAIAMAERAAARPRADGRGRLRPRDARPAAAGRRHPCSVPYGDVAIPARRLAAGDHRDDGGGGRNRDRRPAARLAGARDQPRRRSATSWRCVTGPAARSR